MSGKGAESQEANSACPRCGVAFRCGMVGGDAKCWCATLPVVDPLPVPRSGSTASCYCQGCLAAIKAENLAGAAGP